MVALAQHPYQSHSKPASHARAQDRSRISSAPNRLNPPPRFNLCQSTYHFLIRLGSCSRDPIAFRHTVKYKAYAYVNNSPVLNTDPTGLCPFGPETWGRHPAGPNNGPNRRVRCSLVNGQRVFECRGNQQDPTFDATQTDGCSTPWGGTGPFDFSSACDTHDRCFNRCSGASLIAFQQCNYQFEQDLDAICEQLDPSHGESYQNCSAWAEGYYQAVSTTMPVLGGILSSGWDHFQVAQDSACIWNPCNISCSDLANNRPLHPSSWPWPWR